MIGSMEDPPGSFQSRRWRVGRKLRRTFYAVRGSEPSDEDDLIGITVGSEQQAYAMAAYIVRLHNAELDRRKTREGWSGLDPH